MSFILLQRSCFKNKNQGSVSCRTLAEESERLPDIKIDPTIITDNIFSDDSSFYCSPLKYKLLKVQLLQTDLILEVPQKFFSMHVSVTVEFSVTEF